MEDTVSLTDNLHNSFSVHGSGRTKSLKDDVEDWTTQFTEPWAKFVANAIPGEFSMACSISLLTEFALLAPIRRIPGTAVTIDTNEDGIPLIPQLDLTQNTPATVAIVLTQYLEVLWREYSESGCGPCGLSLILFLQVIIQAPLVRTFCGVRSNRRPHSTTPRYTNSQ